jgi:nucleotide-binding universal stress UspA family protein
MPVMFERVLIPLDGSSLAECTIPYGLSIQRRFSSHILLYRVIESAGVSSSRLSSVDWCLERDAALEYLEGVALRFPVRSGRPALEIEVASGPASPAIVEKIRRAKVDLVLLATHGAGGLGCFPIGGTAQKVVSAAEASVLVVRARHPLPTAGFADLDRILVGIDGSASSEWAAHVAASIPAEAGTEVLLLYVVSRLDTLGKYRMGSEECRVLERLVEAEREEGERRLERLARQIGHAGVTIRTRVVVDDPASLLDEIATRERHSLIVLGAHGRSPRTRWPYGSVAAALIQNGSTPVLVLQDGGRRLGRVPVTRSTAAAPVRSMATRAWRG